MQACASLYDGAIALPPRFRQVWQELCMDVTLFGTSSRHTYKAKFGKFSRGKVQQASLRRRGCGWSKG